MSAERRRFIKSAVKFFWFFTFCAATVIISSLVYRAVNPDLVVLRKAERLAAQGQIFESVALLTTSGHKFDRHVFFENIFRVCLEKEQYDSALEIALAFLTETDGKGEISALPADEFIASGCFNEASVFLQKALEIRPESRGLRFRYARVLSWLDKFDESIIQYKIILGDN